MPETMRQRVAQRLVEIGTKVARRSSGPLKLLLIGVAVADASSQLEEHGPVKGAAFIIADYTPVVGAVKGVAEGSVDLLALAWDIYDYYEYDSNF